MNHQAMGLIWKSGTAVASKAAEQGSTPWPDAPMPNFDPATGKRLGNAAQQRKKLQTHREEVDRDIKRGKKPGPIREALQYADIPPPDLNETASMIRYGTQVLAVVMDQTMLDTSITEDQRRRELRDGAAKLGMIRDKAGEQEKIAKARKTAERDAGNDGLEPLTPSGPKQ